MILIACVLGLLYGLLIRKGNWRSILHKHFRLLWLLFAAVLIEMVLVTPYLDKWQMAASILPVLRTVLALCQYGLMLVFLFVNSRKPGVLAVFAGTFLNGLVIVLNQGRMPVGQAVSRFGAEAAEKVSAAPGYFLAAGSESLLFLGDVLPFWTLGWYMISVGDLLIAVGLFFLAAYMSRRVTRLRPKA